MAIYRIKYEENVGTTMEESIKVAENFNDLIEILQQLNGRINEGKFITSIVLEVNPY